MHSSCEPRLPLDGDPYRATTAACDEGPGLSRRKFLGGLGSGALIAVAGRALMVGSLGTVPLIAHPSAAAADSGRHLGGRPSRHGPEVLVDWYSALYSGLMDEGTTPPPAARIYACVGIAAYEAVAGRAPGFVSLAGQLNGLRATPRASDPSALDWPLVVSASIAATAGSLLRNGSQALRAALDEQLATHLDERSSVGVPAQVVRRSVVHGRGVGEHVASWAREDGAEQTFARPYSPPVGEALWRSTPPNFGTAIDPHWGSVRPMVLPSAGFCAPPAPPADFSTSPTSAFYHQAQAVLDTHDVLTDEQKSIALFWRDNPITSGLPAGHWMLLAGQLSQERGLALDEAAEVHAMAAIALADAFTSCWYEKYLTNLLRPVSYIRAHVPGREGWLSFVNTPQFPEYTSGHSVASQSVVTVLTDRLGVFPFTDRTHQVRTPQLGSRSYSSLQAAADAAANSRLLGGIHYPMGIDKGLAQGAHVGRTLLERVTTRRVRRP